MRGDFSPSNSDEHEGVPGIRAIHAGIQAGRLHTSAYCRLPPPCTPHTATYYLLSNTSQRLKRTNPWVVVRFPE